MVLYRGSCLVGEFSLSDAHIWNHLADPSRSADFYMSMGSNFALEGTSRSRAVDHPWRTTRRHVTTHNCRPRRVRVCSCVWLGTRAGSTGEWLGVTPGRPARPVPNRVRRPGRIGGLFWILFFHVSSAGRGNQTSQKPRESTGRESGLRNMMTTTTEHVSSLYPARHGLIPPRTKIRINSGTWHVMSAHVLKSELKYGQISLRPALLAKNLIFPSFDCSFFSIFLTKLKNSLK